MTNALMELADRLDAEAEKFGDPLLSYLDHATSALLREAATQLRTAAAEGGEAVAYVGDSGKLRWVASYQMQVGMQLYLHPPTDSGAGRDGWQEFVNNPSDEMVEAILDAPVSFDAKIRTFVRGDTMATGWPKSAIVRQIIDEYYGQLAKAGAPPPKDTAIAGAAGE